MTAHVTRIAPSPTGLLHLGTARTALFNWLAAKASGGRFIVRIDDTDNARNDPAAVNVIHESLSWLGLDADHCFHQSDRLDMYRVAADALVKQDLACIDDGAVRLKRKGFLNDVDGRHGFHAFEDTVRGMIAITEKDRDVIDGIVLLRSDGMPTYHFASVYDDMDCGVTWVIRGTDHISNTPKHLAIWNALAQIEWSGSQAQKPTWSHVGLLTSGKKKLSKRDGAASVLDYRNRGVDPDAMANWLLRMGWGPKNEDRSHRTIERDRAIELFIDAGNMRSSPAEIDLPLLDSLDRRYKAKKEKELKTI